MVEYRIFGRGGDGAYDIASPLSSLFRPQFSSAVPKGIETLPSPWRAALQVAGGKFGIRIGLHMDLETLLPVVATEGGSGRRPAPWSYLGAPPARPGHGKPVPSPRSRADKGRPAQGGRTRSSSITGRRTRHCPLEGTYQYDIDLGHPGPEFTAPLDRCPEHGDPCVIDRIAHHDGIGETGHLSARFRGIDPSAVKERLTGPRLPMRLYDPGIPVTFRCTRCTRKGT